MKKFKREIAAIITGAIIGLPMVSCNKTDVTPLTNSVSVDVKQKTDNLSKEQISFLEDLDLITEATSKNVSEQPKKEKNSQINYVNPINPFESIGEQAYEIFTLSKPHINEAISNDVSLCEKHMELNGSVVCSHTEKPLSANNSKENLEKVFAKSIQAVTGEDITSMDLTPTPLHERTDLTTFEKEVMTRYLEAINRAKTLENIITISISFENQLLHSPLNANGELNEVVRGITTAKYTVGFMLDNGVIGGDNSDPLQKVTEDDVICYIGSVAFGIPCPLCGIGIGLGCLAGAHWGWNN